jgi:hypothetical protein
MCSVAEIFAEVLTMQRQGRSTLAIHGRIIDLGNIAGLRPISRSSGSNKRIDFSSDEAITFDGARWQHE